ncbi:long-chain-fatty-acid--CoA ligase [Siminovitchia terrae]|uniref:Long-chain-fatty-acid--CoA ligase n=1 Tax=Siminovitchia terrae TaxID=1914933 RepID=A0ABQ4L1Z8_SIMTE|nr:AMP-binding protein [Siminovitchia terrae]GIN98311.1 long-chain-fatty-acid--CoA ligase [Siminovitchia terrae]
MNIAEMAVKNIENYGEYPFITYEGKNYTNLELEEKSNKLAAYLREQGLEEDDRVIIMLPNMPEVLISYQAALKNGAVIVPINDSLNKYEVQYVVNHCEPTFIITNVENEYKIPENCTGTIPNTIVIDSDEIRHVFKQKDCEAIDIVYKHKDDVAAIIYTSGTTGTPKGAMITHGNIHSVYLELQALELLGKDHKTLVELGFSMLVVLPISHIYGLTVTMMSYLAGARIVLMPRFDIEEIFQHIENEKIRLFSGVPTIFYRMAQYGQLKHVDVSSVKYWISGAAPLSEEVRKFFESQFKTRMIEGYGLTESTSSFALQRLHSIKDNSVGKPFPESDVAVFDENHRQLPKGSVGELAIKGPNVMKGYYKMAEETERVLREGWLMTGDVGYMDEDEDIFIVDRKKDMIIRGGFNVYPVEVEKILNQHPSVLEAGVIGVKNKDMGEKVKAFVALQPGKVVTEEELLNYCKSKLATYKVPEEVAFLSELPVNELGKVVRKELRKL